jgi:hypothetical protein
MPAVQCSATFFFYLVCPWPKKHFPQKIGWCAEIPFVPITCHVIMGNKDYIACYIIGMLHLIWHINKDGKQMLIPCQAGYEDENTYLLY